MAKRLLPSKILVTGAAGFIGSHLVDALVKQGESVRCLVRKQDNLEFLPKKGVEIVIGDITDKKSLRGIFEGIEVVYHLAAKTDFEGKTWQEYYRPNVLGTQNLVDLAIKQKVKQFIFFSTIRTVGLKDSKDPVDESAPYNPLNYYDRSKVEGEKILLNAYKRKKLPITIIRPSSVYGPRDRGTYFSFFKAIAQSRFFLIGKGKNLVSFVYVGNIVAAALLAKGNKKSFGQIYFVSDERPYTMRELSSTIASSFGRKLPKFYLPIILGYPVGYFLLAVGGIFNFKPPLTPERVKNLTISYVFNLEKAKRELGYKPSVGFPEGVKKTADWYKKHGWI